MYEFTKNIFQIISQEDELEGEALVLQSVDHQESIITSIEKTVELDTENTTTFKSTGGEFFEGNQSTKDLDENKHTEKSLQNLDDIDFWELCSKDFEQKEIIAPNPSPEISEVEEKEEKIPRKKINFPLMKKNYFKGSLFLHSYANLFKTMTKSNLNQTMKKMDNFKVKVTNTSGSFLISC